MSVGTEGQAGKEGDRKLGEVHERFTYYHMRGTQEALCWCHIEALVKHKCSSVHFVPESKVVRGCSQVISATKGGGVGLTNADIG